MPRILPRLLEKLDKEKDRQKFFPFKRQRSRIRSRYKLPLPSPSFHPEDHPKSILLSPLSPVAYARDYVRHKRAPPSLNPPNPAHADHQVDPPRQMTKEEFSWWSNPYLRMLTSPRRTCMLTQRSLPSDLLVRVIGMRLPPSETDRSYKSNNVLVPDGILHRKYANVRGSAAGYILCWRKAVVQCVAQGRFKRLSQGIMPSPHLADHIAHLLRVRVLQEFELLAEQVEFEVKRGKTLGISNFILRRLTSEEWKFMRSSGTLPYDNGVAVLILPPINKDPVTKKRPLGEFTPLPPADERRPNASILPTSTLLPAFADSPNILLPDVLPSLKIPLYNCAAAFPSPSQRVALRSLLGRILAAESLLKGRHLRKGTLNNSQRATESSKRSPAFLLCSDGLNVRRGNAAAIAIALWRLRMYEGEGWLDLQQ